MLDKNLLLYLSFVSTFATAGSNGCKHKGSTPVKPSTRVTPTLAPTAGTAAAKTAGLPDGSSGIGAPGNTPGSTNPAAGTGAETKGELATENTPPVDPAKDPFDTLKEFCVKITGFNTAITERVKRHNINLEKLSTINIRADDAAATDEKCKFYNLYELVKESFDVVKAYLPSFIANSASMEKDPEKKKYVAEFRAQYNLLEPVWKKVDEENKRRVKLERGNSPDQNKVALAVNEMNTADRELCNQVRALFTAVGMLHTELIKAEVQAVLDLTTTAAAAAVVTSDPGSIGNNHPALNKLTEHVATYAAAVTVNNFPTAHAEFTGNVMSQINVLQAAVAAATGAAAADTTEVPAQPIIDLSNKITPVFDLFTGIAAELTAVLQLSATTRALVVPAGQKYELSLEIKPRADVYKAQVDLFKSKVTNINTALQELQQHMSHIGHVTIEETEKQVEKAKLMTMLEEMERQRETFTRDPNEHVALYRAFFNKRPAAEPASNEVFDEINAIKDGDDLVTEGYRLRLWFTSKLSEVKLATTIGDLTKLKTTIKYMQKYFHEAIKEESVRLDTQQALITKATALKTKINTKSNPMDKKELSTRVTENIGGDKRLTSYPKEAELREKILLLNKESDECQVGLFVDETLKDLNGGQKSTTELTVISKELEVLTEAVHKYFMTGKKRKHSGEKNPEGPKN
ncbi:MAG: hypothetical protein K2X94_04070 [Amoebophilaceae bacterium]|nr:hypothetical protein [Amoebophilaceae bacterium]